MAGIVRSLRARPVYLLALVVAAALVALVLALALGDDSAGDTYVDNDRPDNGGDCHSPATACKTITGPDGAMEKAGDDATVHVDGGTYAESLLLGDDKSLLADDFAAPVEEGTIIDGSSGPAVRVPGGEKAGTIEGLTLRAAGSAVELGGPAAVTGNTFDSPGPDSTGIEILNADAGESAITDNLFSGAGGAARHSGVSGVGSPIISANRFSGLSDPISLGAGSANVLGNTFTGTHAAGSGGGTEIAANGGAAPTIVANRLEPPARGAGTVGVKLEGGTSGGAIRRNRILGHEIGVLVLGTGGPVTLDGDLIAGSTRWGLSLQAGGTPEGGDTTVISSTIFDNAIDIHLDGPFLTLDSTIVSNPIQVGSGADCEITFSRGPTTTGTACQSFQTDAAPGFPAVGLTDPRAYHLTLGSPMVELGSIETPPNTSTLDLDGEPRTFDADCDGEPRRDIGADEVPRTCPDSTTTTSG